jgi:nitroreductase
MEFTEILKNRKSVMDFKPDDISEDDLSFILAAGSMAPNGTNKRNKMHFTVVRSEKIFNAVQAESDKIFGANNANKQDGKPSKANIFSNAPVVVVISSANNEIDGLADQNSAVMAENMLLAATSLGIGSHYLTDACIIIRQSQELTNMLEIPNGFKPCVCVCLGYSNDPKTCDRRTGVYVETNWV